MEKPMPTPMPMEPMDTYLCILLSINVITTTQTYTQAQICYYVAENQTTINNVMSSPVKLQSVRTQYMTQAQSIIVINKTENCNNGDGDGHGI
jgi:hypothetical protein